MFNYVCIFCYHICGEIKLCVCVCVYYVVHILIQTRYIKNAVREAVRNGIKVSVVYLKVMMSHIHCWFLLRKNSLPWIWWHQAGRSINCRTSTVSTLVASYRQATSTTYLTVYGNVSRWPGLFSIPTSHRGCVTIDAVSSAYWLLLIISCENSRSCRKVLCLFMSVCKCSSNRQPWLNSWGSILSVMWIVLTSPTELTVLSEGQPVTVLLQCLALNIWPLR